MKPIEMARECAASLRPDSHNSFLILEGSRDGTDIVRAAMAMHDRLVADECMEIARLRQSLADIANALSFLSNPVDLALAQYTKNVRGMAKKALAIQVDDKA